jgi:hypothetical protein
MRSFTTIAKKLRVGRSVVNRRLSGHANLTLETIADMLWALDHDISVEIFDPASRQGYRVARESLTSDQISMVKSGYGLMSVPAPEAKAEAV